MIGTVLDTIIIKGFKNDNPIDNDNNVVLKLKEHIYISLI